MPYGAAELHCHAGRPEGAKRFAKRDAVSQRSARKGQATKKVLTQAVVTVATEPFRDAVSPVGAAGIDTEHD